MAFQPYRAETAEPLPLQEVVERVRVFSRDSTVNLLLSLLDTGTLLVRTAERMHPSNKAHARCLRAARNCEERVERSLWKLQEQPGVHARIAADLARLHGELYALGS